MVIDRQKLFDGTHDREAQANGVIRVLTKEERDASRYPTLARLAPSEDLWVFGYGSLIWNPELAVVESRQGTVYGFRRAFCMWSPYSRGTPDKPGLMLALRQGGCCTGVAMRIEAEKVEMETAVLWAREMYSGIYEPRWVRVYGEDGPCDAVTFVANKHCQFYAGDLPLDHQVSVLATAAGESGPNIEYLENLARTLDGEGLNCRYTEVLSQSVQRFRGTVG